MVSIAESNNVDPVNGKKEQPMYNRPQKFTKGDIITDLQQVQWIIIDEIGKGGFGDVYAVKKVVDNSGQKYAVKIEPKENGPLFTEVYFYSNYLKWYQLRSWQQRYRLPFLGMPAYRGHGSCVKNNVHHRFLIMDCYGPNIMTKLYTETGEVNRRNLSEFLVQIIDSLCYVHSLGYSHGDIKSDNLLLERNSDDTNRVYLMDFGVSTLLHESETVKIYKKSRHNGTLLFCSRDSHVGIGTRRGDLESLAYTVLSWFVEQLPWVNQTDANVVRQIKVEFMANVKSYLADRLCNIPSQILSLFVYINSLHHLQVPDYKYLKVLFKSMNDDDNNKDRVVAVNQPRTMDNNEVATDNQPGGTSDLGSDVTSAEQQKEAAVKRKATADTSTAVPLKRRPLGSSDVPSSLDDRKQQTADVVDSLQQFIVPDDDDGGHVE